jgi:hypothetical protein
MEKDSKDEALDAILAIAEKIALAATDCRLKDELNLLISIARYKHITANERI